MAAGPGGRARGGVSEPLSLGGQEALLSPIKIAENSLVPLADVRDELYNELMQKKREEAFNGYFNKLKESSVIIYMDESMKPVDGE